MKILSKQIDSIIELKYNNYISNKYFYNNCL